MRYTHEQRAHIEELEGKLEWARFMNDEHLIKSYQDQIASYKIDCQDRWYDKAE